MTDRPASSTAVGVAWMRAAHQLLDAEPRILDDPVAARLVGADAARLRALAPRFETPGARGLRAHVVVRSRFAEDCLREAVGRGVRQFVVLGAGLDTFAYRQPPWAAGLRVFEVDQPASQADKRERLTRAGVSAPGNVSLVAVDFEAEPLADGLRRGGVALDEPLFLAWLGVTMYLTADAVDAVFRLVASLPAGTEIVFTFAQPRGAAEPHDGPTLAERAAEAGEPWLTYFTPAELDSRLRALGFSIVEFLTPDRAAARYFGGRTDGLRAPRRTSLARAAV